MGGRVSDLFGLGDIVFPSMLAGWAVRRDKQRTGSINGRSGRSYHQAALVSYAAGCFLCEIFQTGAGQPALVFIVPSMLVGVVGIALVSRFFEEDDDTPPSSVGQ